jgi:hypothetical protein
MHEKYIDIVIFYVPELLPKNYRSKSPYAFRILSQMCGYSIVTK